MDVNVCSRRVHDGFATIRRPRSRPRAVYRCDSEELLRESSGHYSLGFVSTKTSEINNLENWRNELDKNKKPMIESKDKNVFNTFANRNNSMINEKLTTREIKKCFKRIPTDGKTGKQPIYATPNVKYIEDVNKNLEEINQFYDELNYSKNGPGYGTIKSKKIDSDINDNLIQRKVNMVPMLPIDDKSKPKMAPMKSLNDNLEVKIGSILAFDDTSKIKLAPMLPIDNKLNVKLVPGSSIHDKSQTKLVSISQSDDQLKVQKVPMLPTDDKSKLAGEVWKCETLPCRKSNKVKSKVEVDDDIQRFSNSVIDISNWDLNARNVDATDIILKGETLRNKIKFNENDDSSSRVVFATLPRRRSDNMGKSSGDVDGNVGDVNRRLSANVAVLEPLYEHAVSDPVKPRLNQNFIPWWELATKKYRHRSCPTLEAHVVSAFEQSLSNMTQRLQQLTATAEKKDSELHELRETIERLRKQSAEAGLNGNNGRRHTLGDSDSGTTGCTGHSNSTNSHTIARQLSADSVTSLNSLSSACSGSSSQHKKKGWLRSSFSKAFSRSKKNRHGSVSDAEEGKDLSSNITGELSAPNSPRLPTSKHQMNGDKSPEQEDNICSSKSSSALYKQEDEDVDELKKQLREKDMVLTDIRLEALSSAHQLESLKDTVIKMRNEMLNLKQNNERLQRLVTSKSLTSSQSSLPSDPERRFSMTEVASSVAALSNGSDPTRDDLEDLNVTDHPSNASRSFCASSTNEPVEQDNDGKRINVAVYLGSEKSFNLSLTTVEGIGEPANCVIANISISNKTSWDCLDTIIRRCFKDYISRVDPVTNLGLGVECLSAYHLGEASRFTSDSNHPELLPCGYIVGHVKSIYIVLSGYSWLAIDTLIPRSIVQRLVSLLTEHRRVILCGPSGTGKSYLAGKLAHALVDADCEGKDATAIATFNVDHKSSKELRQYLAHIAERCDSNSDELPRVIILENLQHAASLGELFSGLLGTRHQSCPAIIGTMSQATCSTTNLQLHHNFRWVLCANHMEPVKGFLGRYLRRKLLEHELSAQDGSRNAEMAAVVEWLPRVWLHLNKFLETHSSSDVTIGPRLFLSCPMEVSGSQVWFTDLWNYSVIPYLVEAVREGLTLYGRRVNANGGNDNSWEDPAQFITVSYPWISTHAVHGGSDALLRLRPEDVGYDVVSSGHNSAVGASSVKSLGSAHSDTEGDPLLNMLMRLQEAANYSSPHSNDSGSVTSLDSSHTRHSEDLNSSTSPSRGVESAL